MPFADFKTHCSIPDQARADRFVFPAVNVTSLTTANAVPSGNGKTTFSA
jgi:fructose-bisphosphate aldolase class II